MCQGVVEELQQSGSPTRDEPMTQTAGSLIAPEALDAPMGRGRHAPRRLDSGLRRSEVVKPRHFPCFDGLRAIAAITVVGVHTAFISGYTTSSPNGIYTARLEIGVTVFFLISGFLLYRPFAASHLAGREAPSTGHFWLRRFLRIVPAYWLAFTVISYVMHGDVHLLGGWNNDLIYYGFAQIYFPHVVLTGVSQAWSLCTEVSFYLFLPLYAAVVAFRRRSDGGQLARELVGVAVLIGISLSFRTWAFHQHTEEEHVMAIWLPAWLDMFALGMLLAVLSSWFAHRELRPRLLWNPFVPWLSWALAGAAFWGVSHLGIPIVPIYTDHLSINLARQSLYGAFAFFLLLPAVFGPQPRGLIRRFLACKPMVGFGVVSYGIYLWHQGWILVFLRWTHRNLNFPFGLPYWELFLAVLGLATATAAASYLSFERPILKLKDRVGWWKRQAPAPAAPVASEAAPVVAMSSGASR
jgi:peptidoglycan/LPS O-acetylase OafA/YrhL